MKNTAYSAFTALVVIFLHTLSFGQNGIPRLDSSFNSVGMIPLNWFEYFEPLDMAIQADQKALIGGYGRADSGQDLDGLLFRLNTDGTVDLSFADEGVKILDIDISQDAIKTVKVLPDNKILVLLESSYRTILIRLNPDGSNDETFGNEGILLVQTDDFEFCNHMLLQPDGKILILSDQQVGNAQIGTVRRCTPDGNLDPTYGNGGRVKIVIDLSVPFQPSASVLQPDGKLVLTGYYGAGPGSGFPVVRLNTDGNFDTSFSSDGIYVKIMGSNLSSATAECIALGADGKIYVGGTSPTTLAGSFTVMALNPSGSTYGGFGTVGVAKIPILLFSSARKIIVQQDGKILAGGYAFNTNTTIQFAFARLNINGTPDLTFGDQLGRFVTSINNVGYDVQIMQSMTLLADGRLLGMAWLNETIQFNAPGNDATCYVLRYLTDIVVKAEEPSARFQNAAVFPNIVENEELTLHFHLTEACEVSFQLYDANGWGLGMPANPKKLSAGDQNHQFALPPGTSPGVYFIVLSAGADTKVLKLIKT